MMQDNNLDNWLTGLKGSNKSDDKEARALHQFYHAEDKPINELKKQALLQSLEKQGLFDHKKSLHNKLPWFVSIAASIIVAMVALPFLMQNSNNLTPHQSDNYLDFEQVRGEAKHYYAFTVVEPTLAAKTLVKDLKRFSWPYQIDQKSASWSIYFKLPSHFTEDIKHWLLSNHIKAQEDAWVTVEFLTK